MARRDLEWEADFAAKVKRDARDRFEVQRHYQEEIERAEAASGAYWREAVEEAEAQRKDARAAEAQQARTGRSAQAQQAQAQQSQTQQARAASAQSAARPRAGRIWGGIRGAAGQVGGLAQRNAPAVAAGVGAAAGAAVGAAVAAANRPPPVVIQPRPSRALRFSGPGWSSGADMVPRRLFLLLGILLHAVATFSNFAYVQDSAMRGSLLTIYLVMGVWYFFAGAQGNLLNARRFLGCLLLALAAWFAPIGVISWLPNESWRNVLLLAAPVWVLWFTFGPDAVRPEGKGGAFVWWLGFLYLCFFWILPGVFNVLQPAVLALTGTIRPSADQIPDIDDGWRTAWGGAVGATRKIVNSFSNLTQSAYEDFMRQTLGDEFFGTVEENTKAPKVGVTLTALGTNYKVFEPPDKVEAYARLQGHTFVGDLSVTNRCWLEGRTPSQAGGAAEPAIVEGAILPATPVRLVDYDTQDLDCHIPYEGPEPSLQRLVANGSRLSPRVRFASVFDFETWGFVAYVFGNKDELRLPETRAKLARDGYPSRPSPTFTHGPVMLGLVNENNVPLLPIGLDLNAPAAGGRVQMPIGFGVTIKNRPEYEARGRILTLKRVEFWLPQPLQLGECDVEPRQDTEAPSPDSDPALTFNHYVWEDLRLRDYDKSVTVRCPMFLSGPPEAFLGRDNLEIVSFAVKAAYAYELTADVTGFEYRVPKVAVGVAP